MMQRVIAHVGGHFVDIGRLQSMLAHNGINRGHRGDTSVRRRRRFKSNAQDMPVRSEAFRQRRTSPIVQESAEKRPVAAIEHVRNARIVPLRELGGIDAALRGAPGMERLGHRAVLHRHQAGSLRAGNSESLLCPLRVQAKDVRGSGSRDKHSRRTLIVKAALKHAAFSRQSDPDADLVARDNGGEQILAADRWQSLQRQQNLRAAQAIRDAT